MKININKVVFMILIGVALALECIVSSFSLLSSNKLISVVLLFITYATGIYFVKVRNKYPLFIKK